MSIYLNKNGWIFFKIKITETDTKSNRSHEQPYSIKEIEYVIEMLLENSRPKWFHWYD